MNYPSKRFTWSFIVKKLDLVKCDFWMDDLLWRLYLIKSMLLRHELQQNFTFTCLFGQHYGIKKLTVWQIIAWQIWFHASKNLSPWNTYENGKHGRCDSGEQIFYYDHVNVKFCCAGEDHHHDVKHVIIVAIDSLTNAIFAPDSMQHILISYILYIYQLL
jgi:hypothetical protein